jgi:hypothetical protein
MRFGRTRRVEGRATIPLVPLMTRIPRSIRRQVRFTCLQQGWAMQDFVAEAIAEHLERRGQRRESTYSPPHPRKA